MGHSGNRLLLALAFAILPIAGHLLAADPAVLEAQQRRVEVVERVAPTVVAIFGPGGQGGGSGVLISADGYALTNFHVTSGAGDFMKCGLNDGVLYDAVIVGVDPTGDVALIKLLGRDDFPPAELGDSDQLKPGDWAYAMGNPFLLATDFEPTVTYGIVSGVHRYQYPAGTFLEYTDCIQVDASINPGNSGGPLFNDAGELVGINGRGSFEKRGRVNSGAGYAISINQIRNFMGHLKSGRIVDHATLGATVSTREDGAVVVSNILEESEAYRRGLRVDDEIVSFAGRPVRSVNQYKNVLGIYPKGWKLPLVYRRDAERHEIVVALRALHRKSEMTPQQRPGGRPQPQPQPRPDQPKDPENPERPRPQPLPRPQAPNAPKPPEEYKHMLVKKDGFANYYFNALEQERLKKLLVEQFGDYSDAGGTWTLSGRTDAGEPFTAVLSDAEAKLTIGQNEFVQPLAGGDPADLPPGSGGLLIGLHHLRMLFTGRPFTDFYYLGTEPMDGSEPMVDVLVTGLTGVETRWYFSPEGRLLGFDTRLTEDADDCEVRFESTGEFGGRKLPEKFTVRHGGEDFAAFDVDEAIFEPSPPKPEGGVKPAEVAKPQDEAKPE
ncbi:MAG: trypsin-like peptidase domain-containing protein [Planctomycetes bacterium]|nr:trypsin-like peptidase domain-containing protein [Planctomycetota bacterium]